MASGAYTRAFSAYSPLSIFDAADMMALTGMEVDSLGGLMPISEQIVGVTEDMLDMELRWI